MIEVRQLMKWEWEKKSKKKSHQKSHAGNKNYYKSEEQQYFKIMKISLSSPPLHDSNMMLIINILPGIIQIVTNLFLSLVGTLFLILDFLQLLWRFHLRWKPILNKLYFVKLSQKTSDCMIATPPATLTQFEMLSSYPCIYCCNLITHLMNQRLSPEILILPDSEFNGS